MVGTRNVSRFRGKGVSMNAVTHELFVVGRITKGERRMIFVRTPEQSPFPGPWELRAVFVN